jgi:hypothetical protein
MMSQTLIIAIIVKDQDFVFWSDIMKCRAFWDQKEDQIHHFDSKDCVFLAKGEIRAMFQS